jgi:hypothetical protein
MATAVLENQFALVTSRALASLPHPTYLSPSASLHISRQVTVYGMSGLIYNALIRTHHITSRKKVAKLRQAASTYNIYGLICYGGCPGIMYCQGTKSGVRDWVSSVQRLRYKDFQLVKKPAAKEVDDVKSKEQSVPYGKLEEVDSVKEYGAMMESLGVRSWWRRGMGYIGED